MNKKRTVPTRSEEWAKNQRVFMNTLFNELAELGMTDRPLNKIEHGVMQAICQFVYDTDNEETDCEYIQTGYEALTKLIKLHNFRIILNSFTQGYAIEFDNMPQIPEDISSDFFAGFACVMMDDNKPEHTSRDFDEGHNFGLQWIEAKDKQRETQHKAMQPKSTIRTDIVRDEYDDVQIVPLFKLMQELDKDEIRVLTRLPGFLDWLAPQINYIREWCTTDTSPDYVVGLLNDMAEVDDEEETDTFKETLLKIAQSWPDDVTIALDTLPGKNTLDEEPDDLEIAFDSGKDFAQQDHHTLFDNPYPNMIGEPGNTVGNPLHMAWASAFSFYKQKRLLPEN